MSAVWQWYCQVASLRRSCRFKLQGRALHRCHLRAGNLIPSCERLGTQLPFLFGITVVTAVHKLVGHLVMHRQESLQLAR